MFQRVAREVVPLVQRQACYARVGPGLYAATCYGARHPGTPHAAWVDVVLGKVTDWPGWPDDAPRPLPRVRLATVRVMVDAGGVPRRVIFDGDGDGDERKRRFHIIVNLAVRFILNRM